MTREIRKVVVLGANGAMGAGSGEVFAAAGIETVFLARTRDKAAEGRTRAEKMAKSTAIGRFISVGSYDDDLARVVPDADLIFEAVSEDLALKRIYLAQIDKLRRADSIVATVSSGLSIASMAATGGESFARHFLGIHFFNPPNVIVGCELIPHAGTDAAVVAAVDELLRGRLGRELTRTSDTPAFCGNRVGFKVLNECAQLAELHGAEYIDALLGPHTGRAMAPLATIDFVGWDVHQAIVDNVFAHTSDEAHEAFALPRSMREKIAAGVLGDKTPATGGFFKKGERRACDVPELARQMKALHHVGRYREAFDLFAEASGPDAELMRRVILGYVSYGLNRVGEVVERVADVDRIMGFGFNWAPPGALVDLLGARRTVKLLEAARLPVPRVVVDGAERNQRLSDPRAATYADVGRFFHGQRKMTRPVYILGGYQTDFARNWTKEGKHISALIREAVAGGLAATGLEPAQIDVGHVGNFAAELYAMQGHLGAFLVDVDPAFSGLPTARHEAACASGSIAALAASAEIEAGRYECALVVGVEQMKTVSPAKGGDFLGTAAWYEREAKGVEFPFPKLFGRLGDEYDQRYGLDDRHLARISAINYANARRNPKAQTRTWYMNDEHACRADSYNAVIGGRIKVSDCSQVTDGAVSLFLASETFARSWAERQALKLERVPRLRGWGHRTAPLTFDAKVAESQGQTYVLPQTRRAITDAFARAGLADCWALDGIETHDCFTTSEYMAIDHFGLTAPGESWKAIEEGVIDRGGKLPINASGGLIGCGHPVGATGVRQLLDAYLQTTGQAGNYQIDGARTLATLNIGGSGTTSCVFIVGT